MSDLFSAAYNSTFGSPTSDDMFATAKSMENLKLMHLMQQKQQQENERYGLSTPHELDISALKAAEARAKMNPEVMKSFIEGFVGDNSNKAATGKIAQQTLDSTIRSTNVKNESNTQSNQEKSFIDAAELFSSVGGNVFAAAAAGIPKELIPKLSELHNSGELSKIVEQWKQSKFDTPEHRQKIDNTDLTGEWHALAAQITSDGHIKSAGVAGDKGIVAQLVSMGNNMAHNISALEGQKQKYSAELVNMETSPVVRSTIESSPEFKRLKTKEERDAFFKRSLESLKNNTVAKREMDSLDAQLSSLRSELSGIRSNVMSKAGIQLGAKSQPLPPPPGGSNRERLKAALGQK